MLTRWAHVRPFVFMKRPLVGIFKINRALSLIRLLLLLVTLFNHLLQILLYILFVNKIYLLSVRSYCCPLIVMNMQFLVNFFFSVKACIVSLVASYVFASDSIRILLVQISDISTSWVLSLVVVWSVENSPNQVILLKNNSNSFFLSERFLWTNQHRIATPQVIFTILLFSLCLK